LRGIDRLAAVLGEQKVDYFLGAGEAADVGGENAFGTALHSTDIIRQMRAALIRGSTPPLD
jgi:hypothetical protein